MGALTVSMDGGPYTARHYSGSSRRSMMNPSACGALDDPIGPHSGARRAYPDNTKIRQADGLARCYGRSRYGRDAVG